MSVVFTLLIKKMSSLNLSIMSSYPPSKDGNVRFVKVSFVPFIDYQEQRTLSVHLSNSVRNAAKWKCALAYTVKSTQLTLHGYIHTFISKIPGKGNCRVFQRFLSRTISN